MKKKILFILGMHRSGTSALAGAIHAAGISGGGELLAPAFDNTKGFYENKQALRINEGILKELDLSWDNPFLLPDGWVWGHQMEKHRQAIRHFLDTELMDKDVIYVKDPRLCYLLPIWKNALDEAGITAQYVVILRPPKEVCASLWSRNKMPANSAYSLWMYHTMSAEKNTRGQERLFVSYQNLLENPAQTVAEIFNAFRLLPNNEAWSERQAAIKGHLDKDLRHHAAASVSEGVEVFPYSIVPERLFRLISAPNDEGVLSQLDEAAKDYQQNLRFFVRNQQKEHHATLRMLTADNANILKPLEITVYEGLDKLVFRPGEVPAGVQQFVLFPCNDICQAAVGRVWVKYADNADPVAIEAEKNVLMEHGTDFLFDQDGFIAFRPQHGRQVESVSVEIIYKHIGENAVGAIRHLDMDMKKWLHGQIQEKEAVFTNQMTGLRQEATQANALADGFRHKAEEYETIAENQKETLRFLQTTVEGMEEKARLAELAFAKQMEDLESRRRQTDAQLAKVTADTQAKERLVSALNEKLENEKRQVANLEEAKKQQENLMWDIYRQRGDLEKGYRQALSTMEDLKSSISYRTGAFLTAPFRWIYDLVAGKPVNQTRWWLYLQFFGAAIAMPGKMLANINTTNFRTLRDALKKEPPSLIAANLKKLLLGSGPQTQTAQPQEPQRPELVLAVAGTNVSSDNGESTGNGQARSKAHLPKAKHAKKTVLFASPHLPDYDTSSGGKRATRMLALLAEECEVYAFTLGDKPDKHIRKLEESGVRVFRGNDFQEVKNLVPHVDVLVFSFFYTYFDCGALLGLYPGALLIVDSVDVHWIRHERSLGLWAELTPEIVQQKKVLEIEVYKKADIVWAVTEQDKEAILDEVPDADVRIVSNVHTPVVTEYSDPGTNNLLFIGGFSHYPNIIAVKELVSHIFPKIKEQVKDAQLLIAGSNAPEEIQLLCKQPGVNYIGFVPDEMIGDLYGQSFLALVPLQTGAGIKGKICEAISYMTPVVTNSIGNEGIGLLNEEDALVSDDRGELVRLTVRALRREYDLGKMTVRAQGRLGGLVGPATVKKNMLDSFQLQEVSICIVTWNRLGLLQRCIESIEEHTQGVRHKILVHSNGCTDGTQEYLAAAAKINPRIVPILSPDNDVFVIPNNRMMEMFPDNDVVLLNNDTYVTPGWLEALRDAAYSSPEIGIAGSKLLYPDGRLQEFGSELYGDGTGRNIGKFDDPDKEEYNVPKFTGYVSGCSFYIKRSTIEKIGVFDEAFHPCYCEDSDYCYTAWENGLATLVTPDSVVYHDEGSTSGTDTSKGFKAYQKVNFEKFLGKHGGRLEEISTRIKLKNLNRVQHLLSEKGLFV